MDNFQNRKKGYKKNRHIKASKKCNRVVAFFLVVFLTLGLVGTVSEVTEIESSAAGLTTSDIIAAAIARINDKGMKAAYDTTTGSLTCSPTDSSNTFWYDFSGNEKVSYIDIETLYENGGSISQVENAVGYKINLGDTLTEVPTKESDDLVANNGFTTTGGTTTYSANSESADGLSKDDALALLDDEYAVFYTVSSADDDNYLSTNYRTYYVSTANQLYRLLYTYRSYISTNSSLTTTNSQSLIEYDTNVSTSTTASAYKVKISLISDLNMGGSSSKYFGFTPLAAQALLEFDGNNHTLYNYYLNSGTTRSFLPTYQRVIAKNFNISNSYLVYALFGDNNGSRRGYDMYISNVNFDNCILNAGTVPTGFYFGTAYKRVYVDNCMVSDCIVYGTKGHMSAFASYNSGYYGSSKTSTISTNTVYTVDMPETQYLIERNIMLGNTTYATNSNTGVLTNYWHPDIFEDSCVINSYIYDASGGNHSGTFISCTQGCLICRRCFSNSTIYGASMVGDFIGALIGSGAGFYMNVESTVDIDGDGYTDETNGIDTETVLVNAYFEDCYSSGTVEGSDRIGGFVGVIFDDYRQYDHNYVGVAVFNNCYSTASVGMQYSGKIVGGFVGAIRGNVGKAYDSDNNDNTGKTDYIISTIATGNNNDANHLFINCYAAGEVGGITTSTEGGTGSTIGGFVGEYRIDHLVLYDRMAKFYNCYYDVQTTGMREKDVGDPGTETDTLNCYILTENSATTGTKPYTALVSHYEENGGSIPTDCIGDFEITTVGSYEYQGLTGVYTYSSEEKDVDGLVYNLTYNVDEESVVSGNVDGSVSMADSTWTYTNEYYPQLSVFIDSETFAVDGTDTLSQALSAKKQELVHNCAYASTATVLLDHYDIMLGSDGYEYKASDYNETIYDGNEDKYEDLTLVYDTVRDITRKFVFTSADASGNKNATSTTGDDGTTTFSGTIAWNTNSSLNSIDSYISKLSSSDEITLEYANGVVDENGDTTEYKTNYNPNVLTINLDNGWFKCYDFAPGKQWVQISYDDNFTIASESIATISTEGDVITEISNDNSEVSNTVTNDGIATVDEGDESIDESITTVDDSNESDEVDDEITTTENSETTEENSATIEADNVITEEDEEITEEDSVAEETDEISEENGDNTEEGSEITEEEDTITEEDSTTETEDNITTTEDEETTDTTNVIDENGIATIAEENDIDDEDSSETSEESSTTTEESSAPSESNVGYRNLRLLPTAYMNAGGTIDITVNTSDSDVKNTITMQTDDGDVKLGYFNHAIGVAYALSDTTRMGNEYGEYTTHTLTEYSYSKGSYSNSASTGATGSDDSSSFVLYGRYGLTGSDNTTNLDDDTLTRGGGSSTTYGSVVGEMIDQGFSNSVDIDNNSTVGQTIVRVYQATVEDNGDTIDLVYSAENEITNADSEYYDNSGKSYDDQIAKWSGTKNFESSDAGYYYMVYYWRLNDGRYLSDTKLVEISADTHTIQLTTGILDEERTSDDNKNSTDVAQYVTDDENEIDNYKTGSLTYTSTDDMEKYNVAKKYFGYTYYCNTTSVTTSNANSMVAWSKDSDYILTTIILDITDKNGVTQEVTFELGEDDATDFAGSKYTYETYSYEVVKDSELKTFSISKSTETTEHEFTVQAETATNDAVEGYIKFLYSSSTSEVDYNYDNLSVTLLYRRTSAGLSTTKSVLYGETDDVSKINESWGISDDTTDEDSLGLGQSLNDYDSNRSIDDTGLSSNRQAVLSGDTITYRIEAHDSGNTDINENVVISDEVPEGTTYVSGSMKIYKQNTSFESDSIEYGMLYDIVDEANNASAGSESMSTEDTASGLSADSESWSGTVDSSEYSYSYSNGELTWTLPSVAADERYYVEYQVTVDQLASSALTDVLYNEASAIYEYTTTGVEGSVDISTTVVVDEEDEETNTVTETYTVTVTDEESGDSADTYNYTSLVVTFPDGFTLDTTKATEGYSAISLNNSLLTLIDDAESVSNTENAVVYTKDTDENITGFTVYNLNFGTAYAISYTGTSEILDTEESIQNQVTLNYTYEESSGSSAATAYTNNSYLGQVVTNQVETDVTHLYIDLEKTILAYSYKADTSDTSSDTSTLIPDISEWDDDGDTSQTFLFKVEYYSEENDTYEDESAEPDSISYVDINCTEGTTTTVTSSMDIEGATTGSTVTTYTGSQMLQLDKRGTYVITELTDWSNTDYDFVSSKASILNNTYRTTYYGSISTGTRKSNSITVQVLDNGATANSAFPTALGTLGSNTYVTLTFTNEESDYAYRSGQSYGQNVFLSTVSEITE